MLLIPFCLRFSSFITLFKVVETIIVIHSKTHCPGALVGRRGPLRRRAGAQPRAAALESRSGRDASEPRQLASSCSSRQAGESSAGVQMGAAPGRWWADGVPCAAGPGRSHAQPPSNHGAVVMRRSRGSWPRPVAPGRRGSPPRGSRWGRHPGAGGPTGSLAPPGRGAATRSRPRITERS